MDTVTLELKGKETFILFLSLYLLLVWFPLSYSYAHHDDRMMTHTKLVHFTKIYTSSPFSLPNLTLSGFTPFQHNFNEFTKNWYEPNTQKNGEPVREYQFADTRTDYITMLS
jgi:hypothetical protein